VQEPERDAPHIELRDIDLAFGRRQVFDGLSCSFPRGRISVIMGGSGTGKSTILRMIGGLQRPDRGSIQIAGVDIVGMGERSLARTRQQLGMLFQNGALLDSMTIFENVALPLRERTSLGPDEITKRVHEQLEAVGLPDVLDLLPGELSGGMLRRAAFARAIVMAPEILLCDEPFSGLDPPNVSRIEALLLHLNRELGLTIIVTSHHMATSLRMAEKLLLLQDHRCISGAPAQLAASRESAISEFIGEDGAEFLARHLQQDSGGEPAS
jgi:phospholipid/cholesterol/gamma-HCH transport system ATP-binding protein